MKSLIILRGIPGSGKSTLAAYLAGPTGDSCFSEDDYWTYPDGSYHFRPETRGAAMTAMLTRAAFAMFDDEPFVILHTAALDFNTSEWRDLFEFARAAGYRVFPLIVQRNVNNPESLHNVLPEDMARFRSQMEHGLEVEF
jgi:predicted ABC-type ATPase